MNTENTTNRTALLTGLLVVIIILGASGIGYLYYQCNMGPKQTSYIDVTQQILSENAATQTEGLWKLVNFYKDNSNSNKQISSEELLADKKRLGLTLLEILSVPVISPLIFNEVEVAKNALNSLSQIESVEFSILYNKNQEKVTDYVANTADTDKIQEIGKNQLESQQEASQVDNRLLVIDKTISIEEDNIIGYLVIGIKI